ncbi:binding-protein-dependent transport system inner membrane component [Hydrogenispora ethanolica]|uniref:Binding-protein-dependent transport system inner membrane component n=1 Tax=Hydrogenispora ethanolica TaxID=1082276 RepID=A0A4R1S9Y6_HYDET|nr:sugar ABC transporter permease [Hydrogenispora ethanolica]TCL76296.1 binding-protein-dependent transport system inner membrane component [Hydrogenispora ethanolica]
MMDSKKNNMIGLFLLPALLLYSAFVVASIVRVIYYAFFKWNGITGRHFIGFGNFAALATDESVLAAFRNNLIAIALAIVVQIGLALLLAIILSNCKRSLPVYRTIYFFPVVISAVAVAMMFGQFMKADYGLINGLLRAAGLQSWTRLWLSDPHTAVLASLLPQTLQYIGWHLIILLAGIFNIPDSLYEAAYLDGVGYFSEDPLHHLAAVVGGHADLHHLRGDRLLAGFHPCDGADRRRAQFPDRTGGAADVSPDLSMDAIRLRQFHCHGHLCGGAHFFGYFQTLLFSGEDRILRSVPNGQ